MDWGYIAAVALFFSILLIVTQRTIEKRRKIMRFFRHRAGCFADDSLHTASGKPHRLWDRTHRQLLILGIDWALQPGPNRRQDQSVWFRRLMRTQKEHT